MLIGIDEVNWWLLRQCFHSINKFNQFPFPFQLNDLLIPFQSQSLPIQFSIYFMALNEINGIEWFLFINWLFNKERVRLSGSESEWRQLGEKHITFNPEIKRFSIFYGGGSCASFTSLHFQLTQRKITFLFMNGSEVKFALLRRMNEKIL